MKFCTNCAAQIADDAAVCPNCGAAQAAPQQNYATEQPYAAPQQPYAAPQQPYVDPQQAYANQQTYVNQQPYGVPQQPYGDPYAAPAKSSGLSTAAKIFMIIATVVQGIYILPLAWCLPMTLSYCKKVKNNQPIGIGFKICSLLFVNTIAGILMLCDKDH